MDQQVISGLGNLLVDEILWQARLHPQRSAAALKAIEQDRLYAVMRQVLQASVRKGRVPDYRTWLTGQRVKGANCPRCGGKLKHGQVGGRSSYWCSRCQS